MIFVFCFKAPLLAWAADTPVSDKDVVPQHASQEILRASGAEDTIEERPSFPSRVYRDLNGAVSTAWDDFTHFHSAPARMKPINLLWTGGLLAVGGIIYAYDQDIYDALQRNRDNRYYMPIREAGEFFEPLGYMGFTNKFIFATLGIGYLLDNEWSVAVTSDLLESFLIGSLVKNGVMVSAGRRGPSRDMGARSFKTGDGRSFYSGHSNAIMQFATIMSHHVDYRPFTITSYGIVGTVLLQRVTSDAHWPCDVYFGALWGYLVSSEMLKHKRLRNVTLTTASPWGGDSPGLTLAMRF
ncbi:phosphatase PAP2 family protein [Candidatus Latescibacterota bacterium]